MPPRKRMHLTRKEHHGRRQSMLTKHNVRKVPVDLPEVSEDLPCPICRGIIREALTASKCLHRLCQPCFEEYTKLGNHECPVCRAHYRPSRRSQKQDTKNDGKSLYIEKDDEEELTSQSDDETTKLEEVTQNTMQQSNNVTFQHKKQALKKKQAVEEFVERRSPRNLPTSSFRRRSPRLNPTQIPEPNGNNDGISGLSPTDEETEAMPESGSGWRLIQVHEETVIAAVEAGNGSGQENVPKLMRVNISESLQKEKRNTMRQSYNVTPQHKIEEPKKKHPEVTFVDRRSQHKLPTSNVRRSPRLNPVQFAEPSVIHIKGRRDLSLINYEEMETIPESGGSSGGKGRIQFPEQTFTAVVEAADHGTAVGQENVPDLMGEIINSSDTVTWGRNSIRINTRTNERVSRLIARLRKAEIEENDEELDISIKLVSFEERRVPNLPRPYLCCKPTLSVNKLIEYVARHASLQTEEVELYLVKNVPADIVRGEATLDPKNHICQFLSWKEETLAELITDNLSFGHLVIAYKKKMWDLNEGCLELADE